ncbi:hypothetical protein WDU99_02780 [Microbacterium sp. Mu-80]|uniref:Lipoprotein n=2 Tax=Microbacterium bandirmense TaxID=3122050 RepID=A0ABU8L7D4_9MICO
MTTAPVKTMTRRAGAAFAAAGIVLGMLAGCSPAEPEPTPSKTALFASEAEAFAAAEETYRAYLADLNATDLSDDDSFRPVYDWLTDTALSAERESLSYYYAEHLTRTGETSFDTFSPLSHSEAKTVANICLDVSDVDLLDSDGRSVLPEDRPNRRALKVTFTPGDTSTRLAIASNHAPEDFSC